MEQDLRLFFGKLNNYEMNIPTIGIIDLLDILIVAYLIYKIIFWIKETRAWVLFKGILVIFAFMAAAYIFSLNTILWILSKTISVGIIAVIIVFQPELRKALEELGTNNMLRSFLRTDLKNVSLALSEESVNEIITACEKLSKEKTGALIAIEQEVPLGDHIKRGIPVDSIITSQLICNIFVKDTPLHDGATIIKNNKIAASACFLPITETKGLSIELGTRHRAALGLSEVSDALIIVVSEETGYISLAKKGVLYRNLSAESLRSMLYKPVSRKRKKFVWEGFFNDSEK